MRRSATLVSNSKHCGSCRDLTPLADPVRSSLPYMVSISRETFKCKAMMLDEDNIVLVNVRPYTFDSGVAK